MSLKRMLPSLLLLMAVSMMGCRPSETGEPSGSGSDPLVTSPSPSQAGSSPCPAPPPDANRKVTITSPCEGTTVAPRHLVEGVVSDTNSRVSVIIHPMEGADFWVQPVVTVRETGKWKVLCYFGEPGQHSGKSYEVMAFANPKGQLSEGQVLPGWPEAESKSQVIEVVRE